jgi:peptidoglycan/LPS O-acetylase OafA/YrhL
MSNSTTGRSPSTLRSIWAVLAGFLIVVILSLAGDVASKAAGLIPEGVVPGTSAFAIFLAYRLVFTVLGGYVTARLAPANPRKHAFVLGAIGAALSLVGVFFMYAKNMPGPEWYPWALVITAIPVTLVGADLHERGRRDAA